MVTARPLTARPLTARRLTARALGVGDIAAWTPLNLFAANEEGAFFDLSNAATLRQNADGTGAVALGDPFGFALDLSKGATSLTSSADVRADVVTSVQGTAPAATFDASTGAATINRVDASNQSSLRLSGSGFFLVDVSSPSTVIIVRTGGPLGAVLKSASGSFRGVFNAGAGDLFLASGGGECAFTLRELRPVPGNHATQSTSTARPIYARVPVGGRRNLLNDTEVLATQDVTVAAVEHVLSFWGTGTVTLTGTSTAGPLVGTGAGNRVSLTFTPTAGTLTLTVSGSVTQAQLEVSP